MLDARHVESRERDHETARIMLKHATYQVSTTCKETKEWTLGSCRGQKRICCGMHLDRPLFSSVSVTRSLRGANKRLSASDSTAWHWVLQYRFDSPSADLERGWIVLMVARSNQQRSDLKRKRLSSSALAFRQGFFPRGIDVASISFQHPVSS